MIDRLITAHPDQSLPEVARTLAENNLGYLVVVENDKATGVVCDQDVIRGVSQGREGLTVRDIMSQAKEPIVEVESGIFYLQDRDIAFRAVIENCNDILAILDRSGKFIYCSPSVIRILGYGTTDVLNRNCLEFVHPEDVDLIITTLGTALAKPNETLPLVEYRVISSRGEWRYFEASTTNMLDHPGVQGVVVICRDITERKELERQRTDQLKQNQIITEMVQMLHQSLDLGEIFATATIRLRELIGVDRVEITRLHEEFAYWEPVCESRKNDRVPSVLGVRIPTVDNPISDCLLKGETLIVSDSSSLEDRVNQNLAMEFPGAWLAIPIIVSGKIWGAVSLDFHHQFYEWKPEDITIAEIAVKQIAIAIEQTQLFQQITIERQALAVSEERLRLALDFSNVGGWEFSFNDRSAVWSDSHYRIMGLEPDNCAPSYNVWKERVHPEDLPWVEERFEQAIQEKTNLNVTYRIVLPSGEVRWVLTKGKAIYRDETPEKMLGVMIDITDRKELELSLAQKEERLSLVLKLNKIGIWDWDLTTNIVNWSPEKYELLGLSSDITPSYDAFIALVTPEQRGEIEAEVNRCLTNHETYYHETKIITLDGQVKWLQEQAKCEIKDNKIMRMLGVCEDITKRKQVELDLVESEERYRNITENIPGVVMRYVLNNRGQEKITYVSHRSMEIFEIDKTKLVANNRLFWNLMSVEELNLFHGSILYSAQNTKTWSREYKITTHSGNIKWIQGIGNPKIQTNGDIFWDMIMLDVTNRKEIEASLNQEQKFTQQITQLTSAIIYIYDATNNGVKLLNSELCNIVDLKLSQANLADSQIFQSLIHPHDRELVKQHWLQLIESSSTIIKEIEFRITDRSGKWHWLLSRDRLFNYDQLSKPNQVLGVAIDITNQKHIEAALRESESRFKHLATNIPGVILRYLVRPSGLDQILYISPGCYPIFDKTDQQIMQNDRLFWNCVLTEDLPGLYSSFLASSQSLEQWKRTWRIKTDQGIKWLSGIGSPELLSNGDVIWDGIILDITAQKHAELQNKHQEEILKQVAESASVIIYIFDLTENRNIYVNPEIELLLGYSPQEIQAMGDQLFNNLAHPDDLPLIQSSISKVFHNLDQEMVELEYRLKDKQGNWHWLFSRDRIIQRDQRGTPTQILGVATDVTRLKLAETSLQEINQELEARIADRTRTLEEQLEQELLVKTIMENTYQCFDIEETFYTILNETRLTFAADRVAICKFNSEGSSSFIADAYTEDLNTIVGLNCLEDIYLQQINDGSLEYPHVFVVNDIYASGGATQRIGDLEIKASLISPICLKDKLWGALVVYEHYHTREWQLWETNLIQQIALQTSIAIQQAELYTQLSNQLHQKNILLKEVHHRVKNNLQIMSSLLRMQFRKVDPEIKIMIEDYQNRIQAMALVHDQLYRSENFASINLHSYFHKLMSYLFQTYVTDNNRIEFIVDATNISLPLEKVIPLALATNELVTNAFKYAFPEQKGTVKLAIVKKEEMLELMVSDDGIGLPESIDIFNTGSLGMQLVTTLVEQLEGNLNYENNNGTTFRIIFPL